jgi:hypothetical protein
MVSFTVEDLWAVQRAMIDHGVAKRWSSQMVQGEKIDLTAITMVELMALEARRLRAFHHPGHCTVAGTDLRYKKRGWIFFTPINNSIPFSVANLAV